MKVNRYFIGILLMGVLLLVFSSCNSKPGLLVPENATLVNQLPKIYPDYVGVTVPVEIAPLNFNMDDADVESMTVTLEGSKEGKMQSDGDYANFDMDEWHHLLAQNKGGKLTVTVYVEKKGKWWQYHDFDIYVSPYELKDWGLTYRRVAPEYEVYGKLGLYQRNLSNFDEASILENTVVPGACVNCHTANKTNPDQFTFHVRGDHGATMVQQDGRREWLKARNDSIHGSMVYPYWHPSGKYCAYSTNTTHQSFHAVKDERIEVFDQASDVFVYQPSTHELLLDTLLMTKDHYETYPVFSPDGKTLYFCSAEARPIPSGYKNIKYNICKIAFNPTTGKFGDKVDTLFNARQLGKSATHPRPSYDGKYIMFTMSDYGCFPIWHKEADNWLLDLRTGEAKPMTIANSANTDSWHNWSLDSHWFVFTSRRDDGLYTRLYLACVDNKGNVTKPFLLPQRNPKEYYDKLLDSYNTPDFTSKPVDFDARAAGNEIMGDKRVATKVR